MTYAAQVRSMSKSLPKHISHEDSYDINSLRIICQYFVGSIVIVKTAEEMSEGVVHTIANNKICLTLVTVYQIDNPDRITKMFPSKCISLNDVLCISTKDSNLLDVTVKGKYLKDIQDSPKFHLISNGQKSVTKALSNKIQNAIVNEDIKKGVRSENNLKNDSKEVVEKSNEDVEQKKHVELKKDVELKKENVELKKDVELKKENVELKKDVELKKENVELKKDLNDNNAIEQKADIIETKKMFTFNPNAPEFKPRCTVAFSENTSEHLIFSPQPQSFPQVFTPNSAPAIFVPNLFFYAPNHLNTVDAQNLDHNLDNNLPTNHNGDRLDFRVSNASLPFTPVVPVFQHHPMPIFIPNSSYRLHNEYVYTPESATTAESSPRKDNSTIDNELSDPTHWPPLPNPGSTSSTNVENSQLKKTSKEDNKA